jgi:predicted DnaQ family exonuclease/DinG family helicase
MEFRKALLKHLGLSTFVVVDLETTGLDPEKDQIIEVGAIKFVDGEEIDSLDELIDPRIPIPEFITRLTGISDQDVAGKPYIEDVFPRLDQFLSGAAMVGQQVNFDASFLEYHYRKQNNDYFNWENTLLRFKYLDNLRLDTLFLSRILLPFNTGFKLGELAENFGYELENAHRAVEDARATGHVFLELVDRALATDNKALSDIINLLYPNSVRAKTFFVPVLKFKQMHNISASPIALLDEVQNVQEYYNVIGEGDYRIEEDDEFTVQPIESGQIDTYFLETGLLSKNIPSYEIREQQHKMASMIAEGFNNSEFVIAEAGTGTGKSMAYLIPAIEWAVQNRPAGQRVVVSTNTKNLQEQLFFKDIPLIYRTGGIQFKAVLLKGRSNYLCLDKWKTIMTDMNQRLSQDERSRILPLILWVEQTRTGDIAENAAFQLERNIGLWQKLIAEPSYCPGKQCKFYHDCFLMKARDHARRADIVVVNHSLLFSDLASEHAVLGEYRNLIFDEAHNIEKGAAEYLGVRVSYWTFRNLYHRLYEEEPKKTGTLQQLDYRMSQGRIEERTQDQIFRTSKQLKHNSMSLKEKVQIFYNEFSRQLRDRYIQGNGNGEENRVRYYKNFKHFNQLALEIEDLQKSLDDLCRNLDQLVEVLLDLDDNQFEFQDQILRELTAILDEARLLKENFAFCVDADAEHYVYWLDIPRNEKSNDIVMHAVPLNISELLQKLLFSNLDTAVFTSATLAVNRKFDYFSERTGLNLLPGKNISTDILGSPFDFKKQLHLGVADFLPDPRNAEYASAIEDLIKQLHKKHQTGMLVLFTNYSLLHQLYERLKPHFDAERVLLMAQGKSGSRTNMINQFREHRDSVLLGTDSFWEGVDVPGNALELLFIPKLPFDVPTDPLVSARMDEIKKRGGNPFFDYSVPEAIIKFRQGFGRLIRSKKDTGVVIVGDNRLSRMQYGQQFLNSLPVEADIYREKEILFSALDKWFNDTRQPVTTGEN